MTYRNLAGPQGGPEPGFCQYLPADEGNRRSVDSRRAPVVLGAQAVRAIGCWPPRQMCCIVARATRQRREEDWGDSDTFARQAVMRLSVVTFMRPGTEPRGRSLGRIVDYARQIERRGFPGIWVTDSIGRGRFLPLAPIHLTVS